MASMLDQQDDRNGNQESGHSFWHSHSSADEVLHILPLDIVWIVANPVEPLSWSELTTPVVPFEPTAETK